MAISEELPGPFTIIYIQGYSEGYELESKEYNTLEAINAFIAGKGLQLGDYIIVQGPRLNTPTLSTEGD